MNSAELNVINSIIQDSKLMVVGDDLKNKVNRTLLYGYNTAHELFHVYLYQGFIYSVIERKIYFKPRNHRDFWLTMQEIKINTNDEYAQNAHLYSEHCDYEFCKLLSERGAELTLLDFDIDSYKRFKSSNALYAAWILPEHVLIQLSDSEYENMPLRELVKYRYAYIGKAVEFGKYIEAHHGYAEQNMRAVIIDIYETGDGVVELVFDFNPFGERNSQIEDGTFGKPQHGTLGICWRNSRYYRAPETYSYYAEVNHGYVAESFSIITDDERYPISPQLYHNTDCEQHKNENWLRL